MGIQGSPTRTKQQMTRPAGLAWLFGMNLFISAFTFGGGYVVVPMVRKYYVNNKQLFTDDELMDMAAIAQSTPGAIAINLSALAGYRVRGVAGTIVSCLAAVTPPIVILAVISAWYTVFSGSALVANVLHGMQAGVAALIVDLVLDMTLMIMKQRSALLTAMIPTTFVANFVFGINVALIIAVCCVVCIARVWWANRRSHR